MTSLSFYAIVALFVTSFFMTVATLLKSKWWTYPIGINALVFSSGMVLVTGTILLRRIGYFNVSNYDLVLSFQLYLFSVLYLWRLIILLKENWNFWAWSK